MVKMSCCYTAESASSSFSFVSTLSLFFKEMIMETIDKAKVSNLISQKSDFIIQFSASWCGPCRALTPILENVGYSNDVNVYKFDISSDPDYANEIGIKSIPYVQFFKEGQVIASKIGLAPREFYEEQSSLLKS